MTSFFDTARAMRHVTPGRNLVTKALGCAINQEVELWRVLSSINLPLDNTRWERAPRKIVVGRKARSRGSCRTSPENGILSCRRSIGWRRAPRFAPTSWSRRCRHSRSRLPNPCPRRWPNSAGCSSPPKNRAASDVGFTQCLRHSRAPICTQFMDRFRSVCAGSSAPPGTPVFGVSASAPGQSPRCLVEPGPGPGDRRRAALQVLSVVGRTPACRPPLRRSQMGIGEPGSDAQLAALVPDLGQVVRIHHQNQEFAWQTVRRTPRRFRPCGILRAR